MICVTNRRRGKGGSLWRGPFGRESARTAKIGGNTSCSGKKQAALVLAVCVLAQAVPFWALAEGEESEKITPTPAEQEGEEAASTQDDQDGQAQPAPTPAEAQEPQPEAGLLSAPQPRAGVTKEGRYLDGDGSEKTQTATEDDDVENGSPNSLTIYGQQEGTGALTATAAANTGNAGIGGGTFGGDQRGSGSFSLSGSGVVFAEYSLSNTIFPPF